MKKTRKRINKKITALCIIPLVFVAVSLLHLAGAFDYLEYKAYDLRVKLFAGYTRPSNDIIVIMVRNESIEWAQRERGWGWPWPRKAWAEILDYMNLGGANSVAFDIIFSEPSVYRNSRQDEIIDNVAANLELAQTAIAEGQPRTTVGPLYREVLRNLNELSAGKHGPKYLIT